MTHRPTQACGLRCYMYLPGSFRHETNVCAIHRDAWIKPAWELVR